MSPQAALCTPDSNDTTNIWCVNSIFFPVIVSGNIMFVFPNSKAKIIPKASSSSPFLTPLKATASVSNKAAGPFIAFRLVRTREQTGCSPATWFTARENFGGRFPAGCRPERLPRLARCYSQTAALLFRLFLSSSPCLLPSSLFFPTPLPRVLLREFTLCALSLSAAARLCSALSVWVGVGGEAVSFCILASGFVAGDAGCSGCQQTDFKKELLF